MKIPPVILDLFLSIPLYHTFFCPSNLGRRHKCKAKQQKINKQKYDDAHKGDYTEKLHKAEYQYWFNRLAKAKRKNNQEAISDIETAFAKFKEFSLIKKKQVNDGLISHNGYYEWCIEQRGVIDDIMVKHGLFDRG